MESGYKKVEERNTPGEASTSPSSPPWLWQWFWVYGTSCQKQECTPEDRDIKNNRVLPHCYVCSASAVSGVLISLHCDKAMIRTNLWRKGLIVLFYITGHPWANHSRNLGTEAFGSYGGVLLTGLPPHSSAACFCIAPRTTSLGVTPPIVAWALLHQSPIKNMPHRPFSTDQSDGGVFSAEVSSSKMTVASVKLPWN